jgi:hypothetical protein
MSSRYAYRQAEVAPGKYVVLSATDTGAGMDSEQIAEEYNSPQAKIPSEFWAELKHQALIESDASLPAASD